MIVYLVNINVLMVDVKVQLCMKETDESEMILKEKKSTENLW